MAEFDRQILGATGAVFGMQGMSLGELLRPKILDDIIGQKHLFSPKAVLRRSIETGTFDSLIFVGPPGTGKTTVARIIGDMHSMPFYQLHATTAGAAELKKIADLAKSTGRPVLVFIDEIHRYNKSQQNLLLKMIDDRVVKLVAASTENPAYSLVPAFRSRSFIFTFNRISDEDLKELADKAIPILKSNFNVDHIDASNVLDEIANGCGGDARRFLNMLELSAMLAERDDKTLILSTQGMSELLDSRRFDTDEYYDILSAMIKSVRGSDPDAALLWALKLIDSGVAPEAVFRRLLISASEDIGNAFPDALVFANSAYEAFTNVGLPEGLIILGQAVTYLASCPKSNRSYMAYHKAQDYLKDNDAEVPENIRHNPKGYKYPFDYGGFVTQRYRADGPVFYEPSDNGFEAKIKERLGRLWKSYEK